MLDNALAGLASVPHWFVWRLVWLPSEQKYKKHPVHADGRQKPIDAQDPANWTTYAEAQNQVAIHQSRLDGEKYALGFMFTEDLGYWFLDVDGCVVDGAWSPWASWFHTNLPNAFVEYSSSGRGLHFIGRGQVPHPHRTRPTRAWLEANPGNNFEFYTGARGIAFGLTGQAWGNADTDHTNVVQWLVQQMFTPEVFEGGVVGDGPRADWRGPTDDHELLRRAMQAKSGAAMFNGKASFADLWTRNIPALCDTYPGDHAGQYAASECDMALAAQLAFWTGCDAARMERLMRASSLYREKWDSSRPGGTYLSFTIDNQCKIQKTVCQDKEVVQALTVATTADQTAVNNEWMRRVGDADEEELRNVVCPGIANDRSIDSLDRDRLAALVKRRLTEMLFPVSIHQCREMVRVRIVDEGGDELAVAPEWANRHVYVMATDEFFDLQTATALSRTGFNAQYNRMMPQRPNGDREDAAKWALERWNMATVADVMYWPGKEPVFHHEGKFYANLFSPATLPETTLTYTQGGVDAINAFLTHIKAFCGQRVEVYNNLIDWMAWCVQNPGRKVRYAPLLKGIQGDGKTMIVSAIRAALGGSNVGSVGASLLCADFNDWAEGTCVTGFEEMMITGRKRYSVANNLKEPISNNALSVNRKGRASGKTIVNVTNYIGFTNFVDAVPLEDSDRRWWIIFSPFNSLRALWEALGLGEDGLRRHFVNVFDSFEDHRRAEWRKFLTEYKVSDQFSPNGSAPMTDEKAEMRTSGEDAHEAVARQVIETGGVGVAHNVLSSSSLTAAMKAICVQDGLELPKTTAVNHMLTRLGFSQAGVVWWDGKAHRVWWKRGTVANTHKDTLRSLLELSKMQHVERILSR